MRYDGVDFYPENHHTFEIKDEEFSTGELLGRISFHVLGCQKFEIKFINFTQIAHHLVEQKRTKPLMLIVRVYHEKISYVVEIAVKVENYQYGPQSYQDVYTARVIFHCLSIDCND